MIIQKDDVTNIFNANILKNQIYRKQIIKISNIY